MNAVLLLYALGTLADYFITAWGLARGLNEGNPIWAAVFGSYGMEWALAAKMLVLLFVWLVTKEVYKMTPRVAFHVTYFLIASPQWIVVANNVFWVRVILALGI